jgi:hypothetical protein
LQHIEQTLLSIQKLCAIDNLYEEVVVGVSGIETASATLSVCPSLKLKQKTGEKVCFKVAAVLFFFMECY